MLNEREREKLISTFLKTKDEKLKNDILNAYASLVEFIARKFSYNPNDLKDLIQVGNIGILKALENFDETRKTTYATYASTVIIGEIRHYIRDKIRMVKLPRKIQEQYSKIRQFIKIKTQELDRFPTTSEIAIGLNISEEVVLESFEAAHYSTIISLDKPIQANKNKFSSEKFSLINNIANPEAKNDKYLNREMLQNAIEKLNERERQIIYLRYYEGLTQKEISKSLNLSQMHVSRLLNSALKKLRQKIMVE